MKNEVLELSQEQIEKIRKQFQTIKKIDQDTVQVKDWLDDSVQNISVKKEQK